MVRKRQKIEDLARAEIIKRRPPFIPRPKPRRQDAKAGLVYERKVAEFFTALYGEDRVSHGDDERGTWIKYKDQHGEGWAQPDLIMLPDEGAQVLIVGECKLTYTPRKAEQKLKKFYIPLLQEIYPDLIVRGLQICKNLRGSPTKMTKNIDVVWDPMIECSFYSMNLRPI